MRVPGYSSCFYLLVVGLWIPLLWLAYDGADWRHFVVSEVLGRMGDEARSAFFIMWMLVLPLLAVVFHLCVWSSSSLRRLYQPRWGTHVFALLALAMPVLIYRGPAEAPVAEEDLPPATPAVGLTPMAPLTSPGDESAADASNPFQAARMKPPPYPAKLPKQGAR